MTIVFRPARPSECAYLSRLCLRSKGNWGYDAAFLEKCREELTLRTHDCTDPGLIVAEKNGEPIGVARVGPQGEDADLLLFFVDPPSFGRGVGRALFKWCVDTARGMGAKRLMIEAEPKAEPFYLHMGAARIGEAPSASIPGRRLPLLAYPLR